MKKLIAILVAALAFAAVASAQPRALGVRATYGGELSYQHSMGGANFLEADLGFAVHNGFVFTGIYDFVLGQSGGFSVYAGPGAQIAFWDTPDYSGIGLGVAGQFGLEYMFPVPVAISLDWRPRFDFIHEGFGYSSIALSLRYVF
ncbi:MAG: hypothetical protein IK119_07905 [Bacteroidales bacterium]|nr:hypothetical protein [Bacteroidales bacterium]MBR5432286.1 hypothetical protein [Bacteroidales bacterium]